MAYPFPHSIACLLLEFCFWVLGVAYVTSNFACKSVSVYMCTVRDGAIEIELPDAVGLDF